METQVCILVLIVLCGTFPQEVGSREKAYHAPPFLQHLAAPCEMEPSQMPDTLPLHNVQVQTVQNPVASGLQRRVARIARTKLSPAVYCRLLTAASSLNAIIDQIFVQLKTEMSARDQMIQQLRDEMNQLQKETTAENQRTQTEIQQLKTEMAVRDEQQQDEIRQLQREEAVKQRRINTLEQRNYIERCESGVLSPPSRSLSSGSGTRNQDMTATFSKPFRTTPVVTIGFMYLDTHNRVNTRLTSQVRSKSTTGLTVRIGTWSDSKVFHASVYWMACA